jgi:hypothetical protein
MHDTDNQTLATILAAVMVLSVFAMGFSMSATVLAQDGTNDLTFNDQELGEDGSVTVENVTTAQESTVVVTYTNGSEEVVAGVASANNLTGENVSVEVEDTGGFPGEHTAWLFNSSDLPDDLGIGDDATPVADAALASESANVTAATEEEETTQAEGTLTFDDQVLDPDGEVTVENVTTAQESTVVITYTDGDEEIIAGDADVDNRENDSQSVEIEDTGGFPGEHTAWVFVSADIPDEIDTGDDATPIADQALDSDSANVTAGELTFDDQVLSPDEEVTVENVSTSGEADVYVTYTEDGEEVVAGVEGADELEDEDVRVEIEDDGGFPGEHTAWVFPEDPPIEGDLDVGDSVTDNVSELAFDSDSANVTAGELTFDDQVLAPDGTVTIEDVSTTGSADVYVTYTVDGEEVVAGNADSDELEDEDVSVEIEDDGGFPGEHTAWIFPENLPVEGDLFVGENVTANVSESALDSDSANVTAGELTFDDQELGEDGSVTVTDVSTAQESTVVVTYTNGSEEVVAGVAAADELEDEDVRVEIEDTGGFPGEHTAWLFNSSDLPEDLNISDDATPVADAALDSDSANVTGPPAEAGPPASSLTFNDQALADDGSVTVENVTTPEESPVVVTYTNGSEEVVAGTAAADELEGENVSVVIEDTGGFPGEHTAWIFENEDLPADLSIGDDATPVAEEALDSDSANVTEST